MPFTAHIRELCRLASMERDPDKLLALVRQINEAMQKQEQASQTPQQSEG